MGAIRRGLLLPFLLLVAMEAAGAGEIHHGPWPAEVKVLYQWDFNSPPSWRWEGFRETENTFQDGGGAVRTPVRHRRDISPRRLIVHWMRIYR